ncbi:DUF3450 domain-containing protein [bacterium]|nr:DUF3450 domain-containing protein [bacterium]MBU1989671.1 DUF3450 domain-containing protein [bacterium]
MSTKTISIALSMLLSTTTLMASSDNMAESLMKLRAEVEQLDSQISDEKDAYKAQMKSLTMQKSELDAMVSREELKIKQIEKELAKVKENIRKASKNSEGLNPIVNDAIESLVRMIQDSIPFKTNDRIASVLKIKEDLKNSLLTPQKALLLVYNAYADEIRMTKENGIFKQSIELDGTSKLVEVARIGSVMMYFKTPNERVGYVTKDNGMWKYKEELNKENQTQILNIFDAFKKQIRTGYFTLPNALAVSEVK